MYLHVPVCILDSLKWFLSYLGNNNEAQAFLSRGGQVIVRMRGLPYDCTPKQVVSETHQSIRIVIKILVILHSHN